MVDHKIRLYLIAALATLVLAAVVLLHIFAPDQAQGLLERLEGALLVLLPAVVDSSAEQAKRARESRPPTS